jgi:hypothetical protein
MRISFVLLAVLSLLSPALAIKPAHKGPSVEQTLQSLNQQLAVPPDYSNIQCSDRVELSLTNDRAEIVIKYRIIDKHGNFREDLPPRYIYRIPVMSVQRAYISGPWTTKDRVIIRTERKDVVKIGPLWDCWHNRQKPIPRERVFDNADIKLRGATNEQLYRIVDEFMHMVTLLQTEPPTARPADAVPDPQPEPGPPKLTSSPPDGD